MFENLGQDVDDIVSGDSKWDNETGKIVAIIIVSIGFIIGAVWATRIWIRYGTIAWLSRITRIS